MADVWCIACVLMRVSIVSNVSYSSHYLHWTCIEPQVNKTPSVTISARDCNYPRFSNLLRAFTRMCICAVRVDMCAWFIHGKWKARSQRDQHLRVSVFMHYFQFGLTATFPAPFVSNYVFIRLSIVRSFLSFSFGAVQSTCRDKFPVCSFSWASFRSRMN